MRNYWTGERPNEGDCVKLMKNGKSPLHMVNALGTVTIEQNNVIVEIDGHREAISPKDLALYARQDTSQ